MILLSQLMPVQQGQSKNTLGRSGSGWIFIVTALALGLRLYQLGTPGRWLDEIGQARIAMQPLRELLEGVRTHLGAAPLDYLLAAAFVRISHPEWILRLPAALWGTF